MTPQMPCKEFAGYLNEDGYGARMFKGKQVFAHRLAYCQHHGITLSSIVGKIVRHTCDNPPCIEPTHLLLGSHTDNMRDKVERNRQCKGTTQHLSKLSEESILCIRNERAAGATLKTLAAKYGVNSSGIQKIVHNKTWKHVGGPIEPSSRQPNSTTNTRRGSSHPVSKFVETDILDIRRRYAAKETLCAIAKDYKVAPSTIYFIVNKKTWSHVVEGGTSTTPTRIPASTPSLTAAEIAEILDWHKQSKPTYALMAIWFGVSITTIHLVVRGKKRI